MSSAPPSRSSSVSSITSLNLGLGNANNLPNMNLTAVNTTLLANNGPKNVTITPNNLRVMPFYETMNTNAKAHFKAQVAAIVAVNKELARLGARLQELQTPLGAATNAVKTLKQINIGDKSFRGKNGPQVYLAPTANGKDVEIRLNFTVEGRPLRVTNSKSFNAVLAKMRTRRQNALTKTTSLKKALGLSDDLQKQYNLKQQEIAKMVKRLQKDHEEYVARRAKNVRASRKTIVPSKAPVSTLNAARQALAPPKKPGFFSGLFGKKGGTRRKANNRRTRKNNRR